MRGCDCDRLTLPLLHRAFKWREIYTTRVRVLVVDRLDLIELELSEKKSAYLCHTLNRTQSVTWS